MSLFKFFSKSNEEEKSSDMKKCVKFADGVKPGEGTSPSGGEELQSPPPFKPVLPKEKRYKKMKTKKLKKKKKIKVCVLVSIQNIICFINNMQILELKSSLPLFKNDIQHYHVLTHAHRLF